MDCGGLGLTAKRNRKLTGRFDYSMTSANNGAVGIEKKTSRNRKTRPLAADGRRLQDNPLPLDLTQGI